MNSTVRNVSKHNYLEEKVLEYNDFFFFFFLNPSLLSFEAWPHVGLYIRLCYPLAPSASFTSISVAVLSFRAGLTPSDRSPHGTSTETLFSDAPSWERAPA